MSAKILNPDFFKRPILKVAPELLGKFIVRKLPQGEIALMIEEVEAYDGPSDLACHASKGRTPRTETLFWEAGHFYVYLCYGMHWLLNIVTGPKDYPAAVLIRGAGKIIGPARLTKFLSITKNLNQKMAIPESNLWFEDRGVIIKKAQIEATPRIGVDYAGPIWSKKLYRFVIKQSSS